MHFQNLLAVLNAANSLPDEAWPNVTAGFRRKARATNALLASPPRRIRCGGPAVAPERPRLPTRALTVFLFWLLGRRTWGWKLTGAIEVDDER